MGSLKAQEIGEQLVSFVIPVRDGGRFLAATLESVLAQDMGKIEILVVDDHSDDDSVQIAQEFASRDHRIKIMGLGHNSFGLSAARNLGVAAALGRYSVFLDSDDLITTDLASSCLNIATDASADVVLFDTYPFPTGEEASDRAAGLEQYYKRGVEGFDLTGPAAFSFLVRNHAFLPSAALYFFETAMLTRLELKFADGLLMEDNLFTPQLIAGAKRVVYTPKAFHRRRVHTSSLSFYRDCTHFAGLLEAARLLEHWLKAQSFEPGVCDDFEIIIGHLRRQADKAGTK